MRITPIGHAGMLFDTKGVTILCDPWFEPAFFGSWFVFPRNDQLDPALLAKLEKPNYLYISHIHGDHLDETWLATHVDKSTPVLLPDYPTRELERTLGKLGFRTFVRTQHGIAQQLSNGVSIAIHVETSITDGPGGDSALVVIDGETIAVNQNDCRIHDMDALRKHGTVDVHLLQYSGAIWYPMVYDMPDDEKRHLADAKVESQFARAIAYAESLDARIIVPSAGPPCFLDPELFHLNKVTGNEITIFPHQPEFIDRLGRVGKPAILNMPGTTIDVTHSSIDVTHPASDDDLRNIWNHIGDYLAKYQADWTPWLEQHKKTWHAPTDTLLAEVQKWFRPLMAMCPTVSVGINGNVLIQTTGADELGILLHFEYSDVQRYSNQPYRYRFEIQRELLETVVANKAVDWSNALFLSARFRAWRDGDFNENVYNFFKSLSAERMGRTEVEAYRKATESTEITRDEVQVGDYIVDRFCPHRQADFGMFGVIEDNELVCTLHGWRFDLATGACKSSVGKSVKIRKRG